MTTPRPRRADPAADGAEEPSRHRTISRIKDRRQATAWMKVGMVLFFVGLLAILADVALFASGSRDLPTWLNLTALLAPIGFAVGLVGTVVETRARSAAQASRATDATGSRAPERPARRARPAPATADAPPTTNPPAPKDAPPA